MEIFSFDSSRLSKQHQKIGTSGSFSKLCLISTYDCSRKRNVSLTVGSKKVPKAEAQAIAEEYMKLTNIEELSHKSRAHFLVVNNSVLRLPGR